MIHSSTWFSEWDSPLGKILLVAGPGGLCGLYFEGQKWFPCEVDNWRRQNRGFEDVQRWLREYFSGQPTPYRGAMELRGTEFQQKVWQALREIPWGQTCTYRQIAARIGRPTATRAVGTAIGRNPLCLVVPCHRVIGSGGALTGYAGGLSRKESLLQLEGSRSRGL